MSERPPWAGAMRSERTSTPSVSSMLRHLGSQPQNSEAAIYCATLLTRIRSNVRPIHPAASRRPASSAAMSRKLAFGTSAVSRSATLRMLGDGSQNHTSATRGASITDGGDIVTASATDLVTENAANYGADDRPRNVELASVLRDLFLLDPASLLGCSDHRTH